MLGLLSAGLVACVHAQGEQSMGMTLLFMNIGKHRIGVKRFDPDGRRGPVPGALGGGGEAQMSFMPGDSKRGVLQFVEVGWLVTTAEIEAAQVKRNHTFEKYSQAWIDETSRINASTPHYTRRIDLTPILTPELLDQVRANRQNTNLKLTITFNNDQVNITAQAEKWR